MSEMVEVAEEPVGVRNGLRMTVEMCKKEQREACDYHPRFTYVSCDWKDTPGPAAEHPHHRGLRGLLAFFVRDKMSHVDESSLWKDDRRILEKRSTVPVS